MSSHTHPEHVARALERLEWLLPDRVIQDGHGSYDAARALYFTGFDRRPSAIVRAGSARDVSRVVREVREAGLELSVRGGGHGLAGHGPMDETISLDLSAMTKVEIDAERKRAVAEAGVTTGIFTAAAAKSGLTTGFGDAGTVGVGGITLAGGLGFLHRGLGLTIDSLVGAEMVTAEGSVLRVDAEHEPDLFWALRGGGGNFGIVTRLVFRLHEVDTVLGGMLVLPAEPDRLARVLELLQEAPDELSGNVNVMVAPPVPDFPTEHHNRPIMMLVLAWSGDPEEGRETIAALRSVAPPIAEQIEVMPYSRIFDLHEGAPPPPLLHVHPAFLDRVDEAAAAAVLHHLEETASASMNMVQFRVMGGAVARVAPEATAFAHRERGMLVNVSAIYEDPGERQQHAHWSDSVAEDLRSHGMSGAYVGFLGEGDADRVRDAYPGPHWNRLTRIKARVDPENMFRHNHNIPPISGD